MIEIRRPAPITASGVHPDFVEELDDVDPAALPKGHPLDAMAGRNKLSPRAQLDLLLQFFRDSYPEIFISLTTDEGAAGVTPELKDATERMWARVPDLITHCSLLVLGAGLDHAMPGVAFLKTGPEATPVTVAGLNGTVLRPSSPNGAVAVSLHGGPGWFGDAESHDQLWLPLFAALAEKSGVTVVDLIYPLPGHGSGTTETTRAAVANALAEVQERAHEWVGDTQVHNADPKPVGLITFGSGFAMASQVLENPAEVGFLLAMSPRIPAGFDHDLRSLPVRVSGASEDSRGTAPQEVLDWFSAHCSPSDDANGHGLNYAEYFSEHIIGVPEVWRRRVSDDAQWLAALELQ